MKPPQSKSTKLDEELDDLLFDCIVAIGVREEGTVTDLDTLIIDRQKAVNALAQYVESKVLEGRKRELELTDKHWAKWSDSDHPNWQAWADYVDHRLAELEATPKGRSEK